MTDLASWALTDFSDGGRTFPVYRKGTGPGVVIVHEIPGITPAVLAFADEVVGAGFTVVLPSLFGEPGAPLTVTYGFSTFARLCIRSEFTKLALNQTAPIADWLRALARTLHAELGGPGVGAVGMCFTGGIALAMMAGAPVAAPVLAQPSMPMSIGKRRSSGPQPVTRGSGRGQAQGRGRLPGTRAEVRRRQGGRDPFRYLARRAGRQVHRGGVPRPQATQP